MKKIVHNVWKTVENSVEKKGKINLEFSNGGSVEKADKNARKYILFSPPSFHTVFHRLNVDIG